MKTNEELLKHGFDLKSVTWGYRDKFIDFIDQLYDDKLLGDDNQEATDAFFTMMSQAGSNNIFDHVLIKFLEALSPETNWIMRIPSLFSDWCSLGADFAQSNIGYGMKYFEIWNKSGFGQTPEEVSYTIDKARFLNSLNMKLSLTFLETYEKLHRHLDFRGIDIFIESALKIHHRNKKKAIEFLSLKTKTSKHYLKMISCEARLDDVRSRLKLLVTSICGSNIDIQDLSQLDSDDLILRGSTIVAFNSSFHFPGKASLYKTAAENRDWYMFAAAINAGAIFFKSFPAVHGSPGAESAMSYIATGKSSFHTPMCNLFVIAETCRVVKNCLRFFKGLRPLARRIIKLETSMRSDMASFPDMVLKNILLKYIGIEESVPEPVVRAEKIIESIIDSSNSFDNTANAIIQLLNESADAEFIEAGFDAHLAPLPFFSDMLYPAEISSPKPDAVDLGSQDDSEQRKTPDDDEENPVEEPDSGDSQPSEKDKAKEDLKVGFFYDEWNFLDNEYYDKWCILREKKPKSNNAISFDNDFLRYVDHVRKIFEAMKPDIVRKEKYLSSGDNINMNLLMDFLSERKAKRLPEVNFYEKPYIKKRDIAVGILIDVSGSTAEKCDGDETILDIEKRSALILGEGLSVVGDRFALYGFTGNGRQNSEFFIFKEFDDEWNNETKQVLYGAHPGSSTRMGVAVRHAGRKLSECPARKKILIVITDGKPMDSGYDAATRYAQHDVRKANEENQLLGIDSFCISTEENKMEDLDIMFPRGRYVIIKHLNELSQALSKLYIGITK